MSEPLPRIRFRVTLLAIALNFTFLFFCCFFQPPWRYEVPFESLGDIITFILFTVAYSIFLFLYGLSARWVRFTPRKRLIGHLLPMLAMALFFFSDLTGIGAYEGKKVIDSPDESLRLETYINWRKRHPTACATCIVVRIEDRAGNLLTEIDTHASDVQKWSVEWLDNYQIYFHSSDIGDTIYIRTGAHQWGPVAENSPTSQSREEWMMDPF